MLIPQHLDLRLFRGHHIVARGEIKFFDHILSTIPKMLVFVIGVTNDIGDLFMRNGTQTDTTTLNLLHIENIDENVVIKL